MATLFLAIIYLTFISLGLPDSILGSAWPVMHISLGVKNSAAGIIMMIISGGTIISSFLSEKVITRFGTGRVTFVSVAATAFALLGFSFAPDFIWLVLLAVPLGLGAGAVDAGLNNYVALHYKPHHMSWLHCFWGIGAFSGPMIMALFLQSNGNWRGGYLVIAIIQFILVMILLLALPLWKKKNINEVPLQKDTKESLTQNNADALSGHEALPVPVLRIKGVKVALLGFFLYCGIEASVNLWGSSFLVEIRNVSPAAAARGISLFFAGMTIGRFLTGFLTMKFFNKTLIRSGQILIFAGAVLMLLPFSGYISIVGLIFVGLGCAPIYPCMLHETPARFGKEQSQKIMGIQMGCAYIGTTFVPPLLGLGAAKATLIILPPLILVFVILMVFSSETINMMMKNRETKKS